MKFGKVGLAILVVIMLIASACALAPRPPTTPGKEGENQPPVISSLTPARMQVSPSTVSSQSIIEVRCVASDPDGDAITYEWSTTGGKFVGSGSVVSWVAPENLGNYEVKVTVRDGRGGSSIASVTIGVVANRDPDILSLVAEPPVVLPRERATLTCVARDPDGDVLSYLWRPSGGSIVGTGEVVTWIAPDIGGEFTIAVTVSDGKGGQSAAQTAVQVRVVEKTITFSIMPGASGTVTSKGDKSASYLKAGDSEGNIGYRAFFSFDITPLRGKKVVNAKLDFTLNSVYGKPFSKEPGVGLGGLQVLLVRGARGEFPDYGADVERLAGAVQTMWAPPTSIDVTSEVLSAILAPGVTTYIQFEARFVYETNGNRIADYVDWALATLTVTYQE